MELKGMINMAEAEPLPFDNWDKLIERLKQGEITVVKAMELTGTKKTTFYQLLKQ